MSGFENDFVDDIRERHYVLAHIGFRQIVEQDSHYFFGLMSSDQQSAFIENVIKQVEQNCPDDPTQLKVDDFTVTLSRIADNPLVIIQMPKVVAYGEAVMIGVHSTVEMTQPIESQQPKIHYFTLELCEAEPTALAFCQWDQEAHLNLAMVDLDCDVNGFAALISQRLESGNPNQVH